jgi:hypothetical protein
MSPMLRKEFEDKVEAKTGYRPCWSERLDFGLKGRYLSREHQAMWEGFQLGYTFLPVPQDVAQIVTHAEGEGRRYEWDGDRDWPLLVSGDLIAKNPEMWRVLVGQFHLGFIGMTAPDVGAYRRMDVITDETLA